MAVEGAGMVDWLSFGDGETTMAVVCWCGRVIVDVPVALVGRTTKSCGRPRCEEIAAGEKSWKFL